MPYHIGGVRNFSETEKQALARQFARPPEIVRNTNLSGRIRPHFWHFAEFGDVVVKHYYRGGILRHVNRRAYLKIGSTRSGAEFEVLHHVRKIGVNAPRPVLFAFLRKNWIFYHAWLVTERIPGAESLALLACNTPERAMALLPELARQIRTLLYHGILHVDLHPGNVIVDPNDRVYLVDFDNARFGKRRKRAFLRHYVNRWERAVAKHGLPAFLNDRIKDID